MPKKGKKGGDVEDDLEDVLKKIAKYASNKKFVDKGGLRGVFRALDKDGSGELDVAEFAQAMHKMGVKMKKEKFDSLISKLDKIRTI